MLAAPADLPQATFASKVEVAGDRVNVTRGVDGGLETILLVYSHIASKGGPFRVFQIGITNAKTGNR